LSSQDFALLVGSLPCLQILDSGRGDGLQRQTYLLNMVKY
jgi:hypothetical protein